jgi:glycosyltransferase involved in cell wall biosynthesis
VREAAAAVDCLGHTGTCRDRRRSGERGNSIGGDARGNGRDARDAPVGTPAARGDRILGSTISTRGVNRRPRIAYLITSSGMGGAERQVCELATAFHHRGWDVAAISMLPLERPVADLASLGIRVETLGMRKGMPDPLAVARLARLLRKWKPDVLHAHMIHANLLARVTRIVARVPVVVSTIHSQDEGAQWRYRAYRLTERLSDVTTAVSTLAASEAVRRSGIRPGRIVVVPNGLHTAAYASDPALRTATRSELGVEDRFVWLAAGRLVPAKSYPDLFAAFAEVHDRRPDAVLLIAGDGPLQSALRDQVSSAGSGEFIRLLGLRSDVRALMQAADAFVMSSRWEGLPMALLEAGASGLPIVATSVGGSQDAVIDGVSGCLVPPETPVALADAMARIAGMPRASLAAMGAAERDHVRAGFDIEAVADHWERLYGPIGTRSGAGRSA